MILFQAFGFKCDRGVNSLVIAALETNKSNLPHFLFISKPKLSIALSSFRSKGTIVDFTPSLFISSYCSSSAPTVRATSIIS